MGALKIFLVVGHIPVETFLLENYFDATHKVDLHWRIWGETGANPG